MTTDPARHVHRIPGGLALSAVACAELLGLLDDPRRLAALSALGNTAASYIGLVGRAASNTDARVSVRAAKDRDAAPSAHVDDLLDSANAARRLGCSRGNVADLARRGALPGQRIGGRWLFRAAVVDARRRARG